MKRIALALGLILTAASGGPYSGDAGAQNVPRSAVCTPGNSEVTTAAAIASDAEAWMGKCVVVEGLYSNERVHADLDSIYGVNRNSVGGYVEGGGERPGAWRGSFVGRVSSCAEAEETLLTAQLRSPGISLHGRVLGCLKPEGSFLMFMSEADFKPSGLKRRLPGARGGDLSIAPESWEHHAAVASFAAKFDAAMRSGDAETLGDLLGNDYVAGLLLAGDDTAFAALRQPGDRKLVVLMDGDEAPGQMAAEACTCLTRDCSKLWPISSLDADNQPSRPYACLRVEGSLRKGAWTYRADASHDVNGLDEPKR